MAQRDFIPDMDFPVDVRVYAHDSLGPGHPDNPYRQHTLIMDSRERLTTIPAALAKLSGVDTLPWSIGKMLGGRDGVELDSDETVGGVALFTVHIIEAPRVERVPGDGWTRSDDEKLTTARASLIPWPFSAIQARKLPHKTIEACQQRYKVLMAAQNNDGATSSGAMLISSSSSSSSSSESGSPMPPPLQAHSQLGTRLGGMGSTWDSADDRILLAAHALGNSWEDIHSSHFPNKTAVACYSRYQRLKAMGRTAETIKHRRWEAKDDKILLAGRDAGDGWDKIQKKIPHKTLSSCMARHSRLMKAKTGGDDDGPDSPDTDADDGDAEAEDSSNLAYVRSSRTSQKARAPLELSGSGDVRLQSGPPKGKQLHAAFSSKALRGDTQVQGPASATQRRSSRLALVDQPASSRAAYGQPAASRFGESGRSDLTLLRSRGQQGNSKFFPGYRQPRVAAQAQRDSDAAFRRAEQEEEDEGYAELDAERRMAGRQERLMAGRPSTSRPGLERPIVSPPVVDSSDRVLRSSVGQELPRLRPRRRDDGVLHRQTGDVVAGRGFGRRVVETSEAATKKPAEKAVKRRQAEF